MEEEERNLNSEFTTASLSVSLMGSDGKKSIHIASHQTSHIRSSGLSGPAERNRFLDTSSESLTPQQQSLTQVTGTRILLSPRPLVADLFGPPLVLSPALIQLNLPAGLSTRNSSPQGHVTLTLEQTGNTTIELGVKWHTEDLQ